MIRITLFLSLFLFLSGKPATMNAQIEVNRETPKPNLLIIHTDEHNLRTLGCYRKTMSDEQAYMWGTEAIVETPYIDQIAEEGVSPLLHIFGHEHEYKFRLFKDTYYLNAARMYHGIFRRAKPHPEGYCSVEMVDGRVDVERKLLSKRKNRRRHD